MRSDTERSRGQAASAARRLPIAATWRLVRQAGRRLGWGVADQGMSSLSNFAVNIYIARTLGAVQYGAFGLAYVTYGSRSTRHAAWPPIRCWSGSAARTYRRGGEPSPGAPAPPSPWA